MNKRAALILLEMQSYCDHSFSISHHWTSQNSGCTLIIPPHLYRSLGRSVFTILPHAPHSQSYFCPLPYLVGSKHGEGTKLSGLTHPKQRTTHKAPAWDPVLLKPDPVLFQWKWDQALSPALSSGKHINTQTHKIHKHSSWYHFSSLKEQSLVLQAGLGIYESGGPFALWTLLSTSVKYSCPSRHDKVTSTVQNVGYKKPRTSKSERSWF